MISVLKPASRVRRGAWIAGLIAAGALCYSLLTRIAPREQPSLEISVSPAPAAVETVPSPSSELLPQSEQGALAARLRVAIAPLDPIGRSVDDIGETPVVGVRGSVFSAEGPVAGAVVYAHLSLDRDESSVGVAAPKVQTRYDTRELSHATSDAQGHYEILLPSRRAAYRVDLGVVANTYVRQLLEDILIVAGGTQQDFVLDRGLSVSGYVYGADGEPLAAVGVLASRNFKLDRELAFVTSALLDTSKLRLAARSSDYHEGLAQTDASGHFEVTGLVPGEFLLASQSIDWLWQPQRVTAGTSDVFLHAFRPLGICVTAVDRDTREPIARFGVEVGVRATREDGAAIGVDRMGGGADGRLFMAWKHDETWLANGEFSVAVRSQGYREQKLTLTWNEPRVLQASVELERLDFVPVVLLVRFDDGGVPTTELVVDYAEPGFGTRGQARAQPDGLGKFVCDLPLGRWFLRIRQASDLGSLPPWHGEIIIGSADANIRISDVVLSRGAEITIRLATQTPGRWHAVFESDRFTVQRPVMGDSALISGVAPGEWRVSVVDAGGKTWKRVITVFGLEKLELLLE